MELAESSSFNLTLQLASSACEPYTNHVIELACERDAIFRTHPFNHVFVSDSVNLVISDAQLLKEVNPSVTLRRG